MLNNNFIFIFRSETSQENRSYKTRNQGELEHNQYEKKKETSQYFERQQIFNLSELPQKFVSSNSKENIYCLRSEDEDNNLVIKPVPKPRKAVPSKDFFNDNTRVYDHSSYGTNTSKSDIECNLNCSNTDMVNVKSINSEECLTSSSNCILVTIKPVPKKRSVTSQQQA